MARQVRNRCCVPFHDPEGLSVIVTKLQDQEIAGCVRVIIMGWVPLGAKRARGTVEQLLRTPAADGADCKMPPKYSELPMVGSGRAHRTHRSVTACCDLDADIYDRHADGLYRQALLTLGDAGMAEQVVSDVIVDEYTRVPSPAGGAGDAGYRLPVSAYRRCQELACVPAWHNVPPGGECPEASPDASTRGGFLAGMSAERSGSCYSAALGTSRPAMRPRTPRRQLRHRG
jgi:hypothetical protein